MKKIIVSLVFAAIFSISASAQAEWAGLNRYAEENAKVTKAPKAVFFGDSITDMWAAQDPDFFSNNNYIGRGQSGRVTSMMLLCLRQDVIDLHPKYMVFLGGINDIAINFGPIDLEDTFGNIVSIVELCKANKIKPIVCLLFPVQTVGWRPEVGNVYDTVMTLNKMLQDYCKANKVTCVEYFKDIDKSEGRLPVELSHDSIHPNMDGYKIMESEIVKYLK